MTVAAPPCECELRHTCTSEYPARYTFAHRESEMAVMEVPST